jgi:hypothetical protein
MSYKKIVVVFLLLFSCLHATNVNAEFRNNLPDYRFDTDMQLTTDFTLSVVSGTVASGDPNDLQSGDAVCSGAVLSVEPTVNSKWAVSDLDILSLYPECSVTYCPAMVNAGPVSTGAEIRWLAPAVYDEHDEYGDIADFVYNWNDAFTQDKYNDLEPFQDQPVTYRNLTGDYPNREAGVNVYCKGNLEVLVGGVEAESEEMPLSSGTELTVGVSDPGSTAITTRIADAECFGALLKHPLDMTDFPSFFRIYYYTEHQPFIPAASATDTVTINVQASGGNCAIHETEVTPSIAPIDEAVVLVVVTMHNDGDPVMVTGVSTATSGYTAEPFDTNQCGLLGFPPSLCPSSNGFNEAISTGSDMDLYVLVTRPVGTPGGPVLTFNANTVSSSCGGAASCSDDVDLRGPVFCAIDPSALAFVSQEVGRFLVTCEDFGGTAIPCVGDNWYWNDGLVGGFVEKDNTHALAYPTSGPGTSGTLNYESGIAHCWSDVDVRPEDAIVRPWFACQLIPPGARMSYSSSKNFALEGEVSGVPSEPPDASYGLIDGLTGSLSNPSTTGVTYTSPSSDTDGNIRAYAEWDDPATDPIEGAVCFSSIEVSSTYNESGDFDGGEGSSDFCTIGEGPLNVYPGYYGWVQIRCGPLANESCSGVHWSITEGSLYPPSNDDGTYFGVTGNYGITGYISAYVGNDPAKACYKPFYIGSLDCWEFS